MISKILRCLRLRPGKLQGRIKQRYHPFMKILTERTFNEMKSKIARKWRWILSGLPNFRLPGSAARNGAAGSTTRVCACVSDWSCFIPVITDDGCCAAVLLLLPSCLVFSEPNYVRWLIRYAYAFRQWTAAATAIEETRKPPPQLANVAYA